MKRRRRQYCLRHLPRYHHGHFCAQMQIRQSLLRVRPPLFFWKGRGNQIFRGGEKHSLFQFLGSFFLFVEAEYTAAEYYPRCRRDGHTHTHTHTRVVHNRGQDENEKSMGGKDVQQKQRTERR